MAKKGDRVSFQICDVFLPDVREVLASLTEEIEVEGTIIDFSDSGATPRAFAVVEMHGSGSVVVPIDRLQVVTTCHAQADNEH